MASALVVGDIHVGPEQRVMQVVEAPVDGHTVKVPVIAINGKREGPRVAITEGVHGAEYVGIKAARRLGTEIDPADVAAASLSFRLRIRSPSISDLFIRQGWMTITSTVYSLIIHTGRPAKCWHLGSSKPSSARRSTTSISMVGIWSRRWFRLSSIWGARTSRSRPCRLPWPE